MDKCQSRRRRLCSIYTIILMFFCLNTCQSQSTSISKQLEYPGKCEVISKNMIYSYGSINSNGKIFSFVFTIIGEPYTDSDSILSYVYAFNDDCNRKNIYQIEDNYLASPVYLCNAAGNNGEIYFVVGDREQNKSYLFSISDDAKLNWKVTLDGNNTCQGIALGNDDTIYIHLNNSIFAVSAYGEIKWNLKNYIYEDGPYVGKNDDIIIIYYQSDLKSSYISSISKEGLLKWSFKFGNNETPLIGAIGPSGNIYLSSRVDNGNEVSTYLSSFNTNGELIWNVLLGNEYLGTIGFLIGEDETIYTAGQGKHLIAIDSSDGSKKWTFEEIGNVDFIDGEGNVYYLSDKENVFNKEGKLLSIIEKPKDGVFHLWSLISGDYFINFSNTKIYVYNAIGKKYSKLAWSMRHHDPQNTNRWNGGS